MSKSLTPLEAMLIVHSYQHEAYKNAATIHVLAQAHKTIYVAAKTAMESQVGDLCTICWGDGFHRPRLNILQGPCEACRGTGKRLAGVVGGLPNA